MNFSLYSIAAMLWPEKLGLERAKDMTRRPAKDNEFCHNIRWYRNWQQGVEPVPVSGITAVYTCVSWRNDRLKWEIGRRYAIQPPPRGQKQVGLYTLETLAWELDARRMPPEDVAREGFLDLKHFLDAWARFYGDSFFGPPLGVWALGMSNVDIDETRLPPAVWQILEEYHDRTGP